MESFGLCAPIKEQLEAILHDYPGGQLLAEALQNAEDSKATKFSLILDTRHHLGVDDTLSGPAFLLVDNGGGFGDREWRSLQNLNKSEKKNSPGEIGRYGMGSRSYFHYSDVTLVASCGEDVGVDPLNRVSSHSRGRGGGWMLDLEESTTSPPVFDEYSKLFHIPDLDDPNFQSNNEGATFRLPLRRASEVKDGLGKEVSVANAQALLNDWSEAIKDGRLVLFLSTVTQVSIFIWHEGKSSPNLLSRLDKSLLQGGSFERLPLLLPPSTKDDSEVLRTHLIQICTTDREQLSEMHAAIIKTTATKQNHSDECTTWFVFQKFDASTPAMQREFVNGPTPIPVIGIAFPANTNGLQGSASCFLPIGNMCTKLPVHVNASFNVLKNRRDIWLPCPSLGNSGDKHVQWEKWNATIIEFALPQLWKEAIENLISSSSLTTSKSNEDIQEILFACLPNLSEMDGQNSPWKNCGEKVYTHLSSVRMLQHIRDNKSSWILPTEAWAFHAPTEAFKTLKDSLTKDYISCSSFPYHVVFLPPHIESAMLAHSNLQTLLAQDFISHLIIHCKPCSQGLFKGILAVAELTDTWSEDDVDKWGCHLKDINWIPITQEHTYVQLSDSFAPDQQLQKYGFRVVKDNTADLKCSGITKPNIVLHALLKWGIKSHLTWEDVEDEAIDIGRCQDVSRAKNLCGYLEQNHMQLAGNCKHVLDRLRDITFVPAYAATLEARKRNQISNITLLPPSKLLPCSDEPVAWAVCPTAANEYTFDLPMNRLTAANIANQTRTVSEHYNRGGEDYLLDASKRMAILSEKKRSKLN